MYATTDEDKSNMKKPLLDEEALIEADRPEEGRNQQNIWKTIILFTWGWVVSQFFILGCVNVTCYLRPIPEYMLTDNGDNTDTFQWIWHYLRPYLLMMCIVTVPYLGFFKLSSWVLSKFNLIGQICNEDDDDDDYTYDEKAEHTLKIGSLAGAICFPAICFLTCFLTWYDITSPVSNES